MSTLKKVFSVVIPVHNRPEMVKRTLRSLDNQTFKEFEVILVDDASDKETQDILSDYEHKYRQVEIVRLNKRSERVAARNAGMRKAKGEWICWLDSDDEFMSNYLEVLNDAIEQYPEYYIFNFGSIIHWHRSEDEFLTKIGKPFHLDQDYQDFKSGTIGTGRFIFHREILDKVDMMTPSLRPYGDPGCFPELNRNPNYPMREDGQWIPFGNPWGEDYHWFWLITRAHRVKTLDMLLYIEHRRKA